MSCPSLATLRREPVARKASSAGRGVCRGGRQKMDSAQRAATPGATEPTVRNAVRSTHNGGPTLMAAVG
jgi:hypothetical protein